MLDTNASHGLGGGFNECVHEAQAGFRAIMAAMAAPGTIQAVPALTPPAPMNSGAGLVALTLCDPDTPVWLDAEMAASTAVCEWLSFHSGAPLVAEKNLSSFCFLSSPERIACIGTMQQGTQEYPDRSATVIVQVKGFADNPDWVLTGPGIRDEVSFRPLGLGNEYLTVWAENAAKFPRGVDIIFATDKALAALPRTTRITRRRER